MPEQNLSLRCMDVSMYEKSIAVIHHKNRMKDKNHVIISVHAEKTFDKTQCTFMIKKTLKTGIERMHLNITKSIYETPTANIHTMVRG